MEYTLTPCPAFWDHLTSAAIEQKFFDCFYAASDKNKNDASEEFYKDMYSKRKHELANSAVRSLFSNPTDIENWEEIYPKIDSLSGKSGSRNLISHNPLAVDIYENYGDDTTPYIIELAINQNYNEAKTKGRPLKKENLKSLRKYSCELEVAYLQLSSFYDTYLKILHKKGDR